MQKHPYIKIIFFFINVLIFYTLDIHASDTSRILVTDHFLIQTELDDISYASMLAERTEKMHRLASDFIGYEPLERMTLIISTGKKYLFNIQDKVKNLDYLTIAVDENFNDQGNIIYRKIFTAYLEKSMNNTSPISVFGEAFCNAVINYSVTDSKFIRAVVYDLVNNMGIQQVFLPEIGKYTETQEEVIYTAFIDYIISSLGKKVFIQSVRDASYYKNIHAAVSMISGVTAEDLNKGFNIYLSGFKTGTVDERLNNQIKDTTDDRFSNISFSVSTGNFAVLQGYKENYSIYLNNNKHHRVIALKHSEDGTVFNNISHIDNNMLCVTEITRTGSIFHVIDIATGNVVNSFGLPYIYLTSISPKDGVQVLFSACCGVYYDIYSIDILTGQIKIITRSGNISCPVTIKDRIYCISSADKYSIIELDEKTGKEKPLFSTGQKISDLSSMGQDYLIFSMEINGVANIYRINLHGENLVQITDDNYFNRVPRSSNRKIYYFSYYKRKYHIFSAVDESFK